MPLWAIADELKSGAARLVLPDWRPPASAIQAVYSSARHLPARVRLFMEFAAAELARGGF